jgi:hypothetical protein
MITNEPFAIAGLIVEMVGMEWDTMSRSATF